MMIIMKTDASQKEISFVIERVESFGLRAHISEGTERTIIGAIGDGRPVQKELFMHLAGVDRILPITRPYKLASREFQAENSVFPLDGIKVGGDEIILIAGPCSVESRSQLLETALAVREAGAHALRGGVYNPRTSPYAFGGLGEAGRWSDRHDRERGGEHAQEPSKHADPPGDPASIPAER